MKFMKSVITRSVLVTTLVLGACMAVLLSTANNRIQLNLENDFAKKSIEITGFISNQINTGTRLKRAAMIEPQLNALLQDPSLDAAALRVTHVEGVEVANLVAEDQVASDIPAMSAPDFSLEPTTEIQGSFMSVRAPIILGAGENATLVGELVVVWDKSEYLRSAAALTGFLRNAFLATAGAVALALMISIYMIIGRPLSGMVSALTAVAQGRTDVHLPRSNTTEVRQMVDTVEVFLGITKERARLLEDLSVVMEKAKHGDFSGRVQIEGDAADERNNLRNLVNGLMVAVDTGLKETIRALEGLSNRDLTVRMGGDGEGAFGKLRDDVARTASELNATIQAIQGRAREVQQAAGRLSASSDQSSRRSQNNAATLEETTASISVVSDALSSTAQIAHDAKSISDTANMHARKGQEVVTGLVEKMNGIRDSSMSISDIVTLIDDVAFQTNLLALNAGVEAARAGEHGRGFAVVASEVRALAQRTSESASSIKTLVATSSEEISLGVEQAQQAGQSIGEIVESIDQLGNQIADISAKASDQATAIDEIRSAITDLDRSTQENAAVVNETSELAHELSNGSRSMMEMVAVFEVEQSGGQGHPMKAVA
ncbi:methyl-accepting chemotaxis protein [Yoonia sp. BS5-3]|uniref:Methyl-accepting chemotaxis protein n=1 Tax=Yoonia phaeophyticola TaxID=3137369 RepID=A0ABZ2V8H2_9RHOB